MTRKDAEFIDMATKLATGNEPAGGARLGAVLTIRNKVIAFGWNKNKSHPFQAEYSKNNEAIMLHAETDAIKNALRTVDVDTLRKATLYVARVKRSSSGGPFVTGLAKPCSGCLRAITTFELKRVVYTTDDGKIEALTRH